MKMGRVSRSKQLNQTSQSINPAKTVTVQSQSNPPSQKDDSGSHKEGSSGSSPHSEGSPRPNAYVRLLNYIMSYLQMFHCLRITVYPSQECRMVAPLVVRRTNHIRGLDQTGLQAPTPVMHPLLLENLLQDATQRVEREAESI